MKKGSVTVYMTWMLAVLLSLFVTVIEGARQRAISIQAETAVDLAVYSVFAEYNRALFDAYDLLFIDTSYGEKTGSLARAKKHFSYYANENLMQGQTAAMADLTKCFLSDVSFPAYAYATDQKGAVFEKQAIRYMEQKYGLSYVAELKNELIAAKESGLLTRDVTAERQQNQRIIASEKRHRKGGCGRKSCSGRNRAGKSGGSGEWKQGKRCSPACNRSEAAYFGTDDQPCSLQLSQRRKAGGNRPYFPGAGKNSGKAVV